MRCAVAWLCLKAADHLHHEHDDRADRNDERKPPPEHRPHCPNLIAIRSSAGSWAPLWQDLGSPSNEEAELTPALPDLKPGGCPVEGMKLFVARSCPGPGCEAGRDAPVMWVRSTARCVRKR